MPAMLRRTPAALLLLALVLLAAPAARGNEATHDPAHETTPPEEGNSTEAGGEHEAGEEAGEEEAGEEHKWWVEEYEYVYVELLVLIALVVTGLLFDFIFEYLREHADESYNYFATRHRRKLVHKGRGGHGQLITDLSVPDKGPVARKEPKTAPAEGAEEEAEEGEEGHGAVHISLFAELMIRTGAEFMTLGFLALSVFTFNTTGGFKAMAKLESDPEDTRLPAEEEHWLHLVEVVHIKLFLGMVFYFFFLANMVRVVNKDLRKLKELHRKWVRARLAGDKAADPKVVVSEIVGKNSAGDLITGDLRNFVKFRHHMNTTLLKAYRERPHHFAELEEKIVRAGLARKESIGDSLQNILDERFDFARYLAMNIHRGVADAIKIRIATWFVVMTLFVVLALISRLDHFNVMYAGMLLGVAVAFVALAAMRRAEKHMEIRIAMELDGRTITNGRTGRFLNWLNGRFNTELGVIRLFQIVLFSLCYFLARTCLDFIGWEEQPGWNIAFIVFDVVALLIFSMTVPVHVPKFMLLMALPPHLDQANLLLLAEAIGEPVLANGASGSVKEETADFVMGQLKSFLSKAQTFEHAVFASGGAQQHAHDVKGLLSAFSDKLHAVTGHAPPQPAAAAAETAAHASRA